MSNPTRLVCDKCGGWLDVGIDFTSWPARSVAWNKSHDHPADAPIVYRWAGIDLDRDQWTEAVRVAGLVTHGFAPIGRSAVAHVARGAGQPIRVVAENPTDLAKALAFV